MPNSSTLREKNLRLDISAAIATVLIIIAAIWYVFEALQERFVAVNVADAGNVNVFIDAELSNAQEQLVLFGSLPQAQRRELAKRRFGSFSDLYALDAAGQVTEIYKSSQNSQIFRGYTFAAGPVWDQLLKKKQYGDTINNCAGLRRQLAQRICGVSFSGPNHSWTPGS